MAASHTDLIVLNQTTWQLARQAPGGLETTPAAELDWSNPSDAARQIAAALEAWDPQARPVVVALEGCLCASVLLRLPSPRLARQRQSLYYLLEPYLPWPAEEIVADFECFQTEAFATATPLEPISALVDQLETLRGPVESIAPLARLALEHELTRLPTRTSRFLCLWADRNAAELWLIDQRRPLLWRHLDLDAAGIVRELRQIVLEETRPLPLLALGLSEEAVAALSPLAGSIRLEIPPGPSPALLESAVHVAGDILKGAQASPVEFRRDALAPRDRHRSLHASLQALQIACLCLLAAIGFALYQAGIQFNERRIQSADRQADLVRRLFPGAPVPVGVRRRLESEHAKLIAVRGDGVERPETAPPAVRLVERLLRSLPADMRYRLLEVRIEEGRLYVVGQVREHADADRIAEGLRQAHLVVENPSTHRLARQGVEFRIAAQFPKPAASQANEVTR